MVNSWLRCARMLKSASMTPASPPRQCRYESSLFHIIKTYEIRINHFLEASFKSLIKNKYLP